MAVYSCYNEWEQLLVTNFKYYYKESINNLFKTEIVGKLVIRVEYDIYSCADLQKYSVWNVSV